MGFFQGVTAQESGKGSFSFRRFSLDVFVIVVLPNSLLYVASLYFSLSRPIINFDYVIVAFVFLLGWRKLGTILLFCAFFFDVLFMLGQILPVLRISDVIYLFGFIDVAPLAYKILMFISVAIVLAKIFVFHIYSRQKIEMSTMVLINGLLLSYVFFIAIGDRFSNRLWRINDVPPVASLAVSNINLRFDGFVQSFSDNPEPLEKAVYDGVTGHWLNDTGKAPEKIMLVVSESWGVTRLEVTEALLRPIKEMSSGVSDFDVGEINFTGLTVEAELRELCGLTTSHFNLGAVDGGFEVCLPNLFNAKNYRTVGIHGAFGLMYDRANWYPKAGFNETLFFESVEWPQRCYSFPGACDIDIMERLNGYFDNEQKVFLYWLTLNSHAFYDVRDIRYDVFSCEQYNIPNETSTCRNLKIHAQFFDRLAMKLNDPVFEGVRVFIVGDHEPVIPDAEEKSRFFEASKVPWVSFIVGN